MTLMLRGTRIVLRDWCSDDLDPWRHWLQPNNRWHQLDGPYYPRPDSRQIDEMIAGRRDHLGNDDWPTPRRNLVIATSETNDLIGLVSWYWESQETNWLSLGIVIFDPSVWRLGLGYEALGLWCQYLFDALPDIVRLDLRTWSGNLGMMRLAEKVGFSLEARFRIARIVDGEYFDGLGYGVLRLEWETRYPSGFAASMTDSSIVRQPGLTQQSSEHPLTAFGRLATETGVSRPPRGEDRFGD